MLKWREAQLLAISEQIEDAFPALENDIRTMIAGAGLAQAAVISSPS